MACTAVLRKFVYAPGLNSQPLEVLTSYVTSSRLSFSNGQRLSGFRYPSLNGVKPAVLAKVSSGNGGILSSEEDDGVSLGTMKLPINTDLERFQTLLFQWANSLCQGANLPLPVPLKVDKLPDGARLSFITIGDGKTEVPVYIDCLVLPAADNSGPIFRATRHGPLKNKAPPGEPRIMRSLQEALKKSVQIARL